MNDKLKKVRQAALDLINAIDEIENDGKPIEAKKMGDPLQPHPRDTPFPKPKP